jgi:hypothetical protein
LFPETGHGDVARSGERYVHVTGANQQRTFSEPPTNRRL